MALRTISGLLRRAKPSKASHSQGENDKNNDHYRHDPEIATAHVNNWDTIELAKDANESPALHCPERSSTINSFTPSEKQSTPLKGKRQLRRRIAEVEKANTFNAQHHSEAKRTYSTTSFGAFSIHSDRAGSLTPSTKSSVPSQVSIEGLSEAEIAIEAIFNHYPKLRKGLRRSQLPRRRRKILNKELDSQLMHLRNLSVRLREMLRDQPEHDVSNFDLNDFGQKLNMLESKIDLQCRTLFNSKGYHSEETADSPMGFEILSTEFTSISSRISELLDVVSGASKCIGMDTHISQLSFS